MLRFSVAGPPEWEAGRGMRRSLSKSLYIYSGFINLQLLNHLNLLLRFDCPMRSVISTYRKALSLKKMIISGCCCVEKIGKHILAISKPLLYLFVLLNLCQKWTKDCLISCVKMNGNGDKM